MLYFTLYPCEGRTRSYTFSIDACTTVRAMKKSDLAGLYFPAGEGKSTAYRAFLYALCHARQPMGSLSDDDTALARADGNVYLTDVLRDICPWVTAKQFQPAHVAAILHFLGPPPDAEDVLESPRDTPHAANLPCAA